MLLPLRMYNIDIACTASRDRTHSAASAEPVLANRLLYVRRCVFRALSIELYESALMRVIHLAKRTGVP